LHRRGADRTIGGMASVPSFILKRLYVKDGLANTAEGFPFSLRNLVGTGAVAAIRDLSWFEA
jgi:hypothetical protein